MRSSPAPLAAALPADVVKELAFGDGDARGKAIGALVATGDAAALPLLQALIDGEVQTVGEDRVLIVKGDAATDAVDRRRGCAAARQPR